MADPGPDPLPVQVLLAAVADHGPDVVVDAAELDPDLVAADGADDGCGYADAEEEAENVRTLTHQTVLVHPEEYTSLTQAHVAVVAAAVAVAVDVHRTDVERLECQP